MGHQVAVGGCTCPCRPLQGGRGVAGAEARPTGTSEPHRRRVCGAPLLLHQHQGLTRATSRLKEGRAGLRTAPNQKGQGPERRGGTCFKPDPAPVAPRNAKICSYQGNWPPRAAPLKARSGLNWGAEFHGEPKKTVFKINNIYKTQNQCKRIHDEPNIQILNEDSIRITAFFPFPGALIWPSVFI